MAEGLKVRLVRCPKCENLLQELPDYSVYRCGGCGAFLRAKKKLSVNGGPSKKLEKEKNEEDFEKLESLSVRENDDYLDFTSANEEEINGDFLNKRNDRIFKQPIRPFVDHMSVSNESCQADYTMNRSKSVYSNKGKVSVSPQSVRSKAVLSNWDSDTDTYPNRMVDNRSRFSSFAYPGKGTSSYGNQVKNFDDANGNRFGHLEQDRVELLRKLDELKEQICRNDSVKHVERRAYFEQFDQEMERKNFYIPQPCANVFPVQSRDYSHGEYIDFEQEQFVSYSRRSLYHRPACPCIRCCNTIQHDPYEVSAAAAVFDEKRSIANRFVLPSNDAKSGSRWPSDYVDPNIGTFRPGKAAALPLKDAKSGSRWPSDHTDSDIDTFRPGKAAALPSKDAKSGSRWPSDYVDPNIGAFRPGKMAALPSKDAKSGSRSPSDYIDSNIGTFRPGKAAALPSKDAKSGSSRWPSDYTDSSIGTFRPAVSQRNVHPITGGSPFITCSSCFEVLKLPKFRNKNQHNIKCGACSTVLSLKSKSNKLIITIRDDNASKEDLSRPRNGEETKCSVNFDNADYKSGFSYISEGQSKDNAIDMNSCEKNLEKNVSSETEIEFSSIECDLSQDSIEVKVSEKASVFVNGQPILDHVVKKVEKVAGPIQPGDYWYDFEAGFWGVMGHPCLGIIPPFIAEFNYPMTRNCGDGNTSVFVNGRELNEKDLKLLASRGLPTTEDKFYIIEISGRVYDKDSVELLCTLGKLAPTVEKLKRGFGMKVPRKLLTNEFLI
ncbi:uncharacterized protein [Euphorbia lathyris]|uniref:uncharacterized protein n=1 Tax=Euphorbia lathyris TaxID=212925 RepID=UPI00331410F3